MSEKFEAKLGLNTKEFDSKLKKSKTGMQKFGDSLKAIGAAMAAAFSVGVIINFGKEIIGLASKIEGVKIAFDRLGDPGLLKGLQRATRGTVTDLELMQKAVQAKNFKIPLEQLATYFEFATKRAIQTGESVDYLVESIITGIGRKSVLVMDNLGISAVELQDEVKKTGDFATAAGVIIQRELIAMGDVADSTATKVASIGTAFTNLKTAMGTQITESPIFQGLTKWLNNVGKLAQTPGMTLSQAIYGATFKADEFNDILDESNKLIEENANAILKQNSAKERSGQLSILRSQNKPLGKAGVNPLTGLFDKEGIKEYKKELNTLADGPNYKPFYDFTKGISEQQQALIDLSGTFAGFFSDVNLGFEGMIDGVITGLKRLVMELIAKAAFLAILSAIFPGAGVALNIGTVLGGNASKLIGSGGGGSSKAASIGSASNQMTNSLVASLRGKDIQIALNRS